jgi:ABC-type multidrug transport system fused ATPase/permease subunit
LKNLVERLPNGLQTQIGQNGMGLSVGERQRVQIARVLLSRPKILVLDEATANLDYNTEAEVKHAIHHLRGSSTIIIIIAHRFSMVRDADHVYVLGGGGIVEQGTPEALIEAGGWFAAFAHAVEEEEEEETEEEYEEEEAVESAEDEADD